MTCATWGERAEGGEGRGEERRRGGVLFFHCGADSSPGLKGAPVKRYPSSYQMAKAGAEGEGRQQMDELTAVPRRGLIW